jgi:hypothetical protein
MAFAVILLSEVLRHGFREALGGLAVLVAAIGVWLEINRKD